MSKLGNASISTKTINEIKDLIKFIDSSPHSEYAIGDMYHYTTEMDKINNTDVTKLNGVDFDKIKSEILSKIVGNIE